MLWKHREAPIGFEPMVADLQSAGLATCLRRQLIWWDNLGTSFGWVKWDCPNIHCEKGGNRQIFRIVPHYHRKNFRLVLCPSVIE